MNRLKELRKSRNLTLMQLAECVGLDYSTLGHIERGRRGFSEDGLRIIADYFGVSVDCLLGRDSAEEIQITDKPDRNYFRKTKSGYILVYMPESAMAGKNGWAFLHRIVMAKSIGRDLRPEEVVHHIDCDPGNNALSNLMLFPSNAEHRRYHGKMKRDQKIEELLKK